MPARLPTIAIFGASGLIGEALACALLREGFSVVPIARRFTPAQRNEFGAAAIERSFIALDAKALAQILAENKIDIVVNCVGVLQDGPRGATEIVHRVFVERIVAAMAPGETRLLIHLSIPGDGKTDRTAFSRTKRAGEAAIAAGNIPYVILRPGLVIAPSAYGGSALMRALAMLPFDLLSRETKRLIAVTDVADIVRTVSIVARRWADGERHWQATWDVTASGPLTAGDVVGAFRRRLGGSQRAIALPSWLMTLGAGAGDFVSRLGWVPPVRSTALAEMRRGVVGDPQRWIAATGIAPRSLDDAMRSVPAGVQDQWFARLYLLKPLIVASLVVFWLVSGLIALTVSFEAAAAILISHGFPPFLARLATLVSSGIDISIGLCIAARQSCRVALMAGIAVSLFYMAGAALLTPDLWLEPLGALVKTIPAIVLMLVALATLEDR